MRLPAAIKRRVRDRAGGRCEYCKLPQAAVELPFVIDHVIARQHGGRTTETNLALCCGFCNLHKGPNVAGFDVSTRSVTRLFHPRLDKWDEHFRCRRERVVGLSAIGRVTVQVLAMNDERQLALRRALIEETL